MASWTSFWPPGAQKPLKSEELSAKIKVSHIAFHVSDFQPSNHRTGVLCAGLFLDPCPPPPPPPPEPRIPSHKPLVRQKFWPPGGPAFKWPKSAQNSRKWAPGKELSTHTRKSSYCRLLCLRIQLASQTCFLIRRNSKTHGFYVVPCFPSLSSPTRGSPRLEITRKCCSKSLVKRSFETAAGQKRIRTLARWPGFGGACPTGDPATEPLRLKRGPWSEAN